MGQKPFCYNNLQFLIYNYKTHSSLFENYYFPMFNENYNNHLNTKKEAFKVIA